MATKRVKSKARGGVTVKASATVIRVAKYNAKQRERQCRPMKTDEGAVSLWDTVVAVSKGKLIPTDLRVALRENATVRRQWCEDNGAVTVKVSDICDTNGVRPDNAIRNRLETAGENGTCPEAKRVCYVRALDSAIERHNPSHALAGKVYLYRIK